MTPEDQQTPKAHAAEQLASGHRMSGGVFFLGTVIAVGLVGLLAALVTWAFHPTTRPACIVHCPPPQVDVKAQPSSANALPEERTFTSSSMGFSVDYPGSWSVQDSGAQGVLFATNKGLFEVIGAKTSASPVQLITERINQLNTSRLPDIRTIGPIRGAHIGSRQGQGLLFGATLLPASGGGQGVLVRIGIIVARRGSLTVRTMAFLPYDQQGGTIVGAGEVDYALTEFRWPGE